MSISVIHCTATQLQVSIPGRSSSPSKPVRPLNAWVKMVMGGAAVWKELTLSEKLRRLRGSTPQNVVAREAGISAATLCRLEREQRGVSVHRQARAQRENTLRRLAAYFGVLVEYLTGNIRTYMRAWAATGLSAPDLTTSGKRLRRLAEELQLRYGISARELAQALALSEQDLMEYMADRLPPSPSVFEQLERLTGVPAEWVIRGPHSDTWTPSDYEPVVRVAAAHRVPPDILEALVRAWIGKNRSAGT